MPYYQLYYHIVWATKHRRPCLTPDVESIVYDFLRVKAIGLGGTVFAVNGMEEHVHMIASIPPKIAVATFIGQVKGVTTAKFNQQYPDKAFYWQDEYGVFSFDGKRLSNVIAYVENQKEHHGQNTTIPVLERTSGEAYRPIIREPEMIYLTNDQTWHHEMLALEPD